MYSKTKGKEKMPKPFIIKPVLKCPFSLPLTPRVALMYFGKWLTSFEKQEIMNFSDIWYLGQQAKKNERCDNNPHNSGFDNENGFYIMVTRDHVAYRYEVLEMIGQGSLGQIFKCFDHKNNEMVAVKMLSNSKRSHNYARVELRMLAVLQRKNQDDSFNIIHMKEYFHFRNHICVTFELLGSNLHEVLKQNNFHGLRMDQVQCYAHKLLKSLFLLKEEKIIHCDLKPVNILLTDKSPGGIKLIDFGNSCYEEGIAYNCFQSWNYQAPEVILGQCTTTAIDMWSLGCIVAELHTGQPIFPGENAVDQLACIMEVLGLPPSDYVKTSARGKIFFDCKGMPKSITNSRGQMRHPGSKDLTSVLKTNNMLFLDFIRHCLVWDPKKRLTPYEAMQHKWLQKVTHADGCIYPTYAEVKKPFLNGIERSRRALLGGGPGTVYPCSGYHPCQKSNGRPKETSLLPQSLPQRVHVGVIAPKAFKNNLKVGNTAGQVTGSEVCSSGHGQTWNIVGTVSQPAPRSSSFISKGQHSHVLVRQLCYEQIPKTSKFKTVLRRPFSFPMSPKVALVYFGKWLTSFEKQEIMNYSDIWYLGQQAKKTERCDNNPHNSGFDNDNGFYIMVSHDHVAYRYEMLGMIGKGSFGQVFKCFDHKKNEMVALKMLRNSKRYVNDNEMELKILNVLRIKDQDNSCNIIHMKEYFKFRNHTCISFELLGPNLYEVLEKNNFRGLRMHQVQRYAYKLLKCLQLLKEEKIIHCDLKPENILLAHKNLDNIKVIDFGNSSFEDGNVYHYIQTRFYRAPEVILAYDCSTAIDMWSLGCVLAELYTGQPVFPGENEVDQLACIMEVLGMPPKTVAQSSFRWKTFFDYKGNPKCIVNSHGQMRHPGCKDLATALKTDNSLFVDFIKHCLTWEPKTRLTPHKALQHEWIRESFYKTQSCFRLQNKQLTITQPWTTGLWRNPYLTALKVAGGSTHAA